MSMFFDNVKYKKLEAEVEVTREKAFKKSSALNDELHDLAAKVNSKYNLKSSNRYNAYEPYSMYVNSLYNPVDDKEEAERKFDRYLATVPAREREAIKKQIKVIATDQYKYDVIDRRMELFGEDLSRIRVALQRLNAVYIVFGRDDERKKIARQINDIIGGCIDKKLDDLNNLDGLDSLED
nr:MAG TPA_asm: hypothetical protein [Caudoviricetes sp.]